MAFQTDINAPAASEALKRAWADYRYNHKPWQGPFSRKGFSLYLKGAWLLVKHERAKAARYAALGPVVISPARAAEIAIANHADWARSVSTDGPLPKE